MDGTLKAACFPERARPETRESQWLTVSVVCYGKLDLTRRCLQMVQDTCPGCDIIVTDNASPDDTASYLESFARAHPNVRVIYNAENLGFKDPHNAAFASVLARKRPPEFFCVLNNDVELRQGWFEKVSDAFAVDEKLAIVGAQGNACRLNSDMHGVRAVKGQEPEYVEGSMLIIRTEVARELGLFSPKLQFMYGEDSDLSLRARERGYRIKLLDLPCVHLISQTLRTVDAPTRQRIVRCQEHNHRYLKARWGPYLKRRSFDYSVLVRRTAAFGDVVYTVPVIVALRAKWPMAKIYVQTALPGIFQGNPHVTAAAAKFTNQFDFTYDLDLAYEKRPTEHIVKAYADACDVECPLETAKLEIYPSYSDTLTAAKLFPRRTDEKWVCLHPGPTPWPGRDWPQARWLELCKKLHADHWKIVVVGHGPWPTQDVNLRDRTGPQVLYSVMKRCDIFVGIDSGPFQVAQAAGLPAVVLFGTISPEYRLMRQSKVVAVQGDKEKVSCIGAHHRLPPPVTFSTCDGDCMKAITVDMVWKAIQSL